MEISGAPVITLETPKPSDPEVPSFLRAEILPGRGMMTLQIQAHLPGRGATDLLAAPPLEGAREILDGYVGEFPGNPSYYFGAPVLLPFANRVRGTLLPDRLTLETTILGRTVRLPANASGRKPNAERCAMHGLLLAARADDVRRDTTDEQDCVRATFQAGDFGGHWLSATEVFCEIGLGAESFDLSITAKNAGDEPLPMGIGWHPYFLLPSGRREQALLHVPARGRLVVIDYDEVIPTGEIAPVAGTPYDFSGPGGRPLGDLALDDCFVDLAAPAGEPVISEIFDPAASFGLRVTAAAPHLRAIQVYAPPDQSFIALEPQLNWIDPFGAQWGPDVDTGMAILRPGDSETFSVRVELLSSPSGRST